MVMARKSSPTMIDTTFEEVDDILDGIDVHDSELARINDRLATLFDGDDALKSIRTLCGVAQKDVAADLGVTASAVAQLESLNSAPSAATSQHSDTNFGSASYQ
jgi:DNA-binding XRE family transcriptional regulator